MTVAKHATSTHLVIPDTQIKPGVPTDHLEWIDRFIVDEYKDTNLTVVHIGDHWDMPSLSSYDKGKRSMEGRRYMEDIQAGNAGFDRLNAPLAKLNDRRTKKGQGLWTPRLVFLDGNHEDRVSRAAELNAQLTGLVSLDHMNVEAWGWERYPFREPVEIDGVIYAHYFYNPMSGRPYSGTNLETRLRTVGHSFTMGHQQGLKWGRVDTVKGPHIGLVAGSCYLHDEEYLGPQTTTYWRGIVVCHQVEAGSYDPMFVSLDYLSRRYTGLRLAAYMETLT